MKRDSVSSTPRHSRGSAATFTTTEETGSAPGTTSKTAPRSVPTSEPGSMSHREIMEALSGLLIALFVAMLSSTVVTNALPAIVSDLHGSETGYTWVVVATLLTLTASTPIWGKLADLFSKKLLVQTALLIYVGGSLIAAFAPNMGVLIGARAVQGLGVGGLTALVQVVIATMVSPRERGRYSGYIGAVFALATVSGPLIGGVIVDAPGLGWRWCFGVGIPVAAIAFAVLQKTLHLPVVRREVHIDYLGAFLIAGGVSLMLTWVSLAGSSYAWLSTTSYALVAGGLLVLALAVVVELRVARQPIIPTHLFRDRTTALATVASVMVGVAMFGATVYLSQYFQIARGMSPTHAGLMSIAMVGGLLVSSITTGRIISNTGLWKRYLVGGMVLVIVGMLLLSRIDESTPLVEVGLFMAIVGLGLGATMQNLVLAVQNNAAQSDMGAASALVAFFRSMGGAIGVAALGALLSSQVSTKLASGLAALGIAPTAGSDSTSIPDLSALPAPVRALYQSAFGEATGHLFLVAAPFTIIALVCVLFIKEVPLRTSLEKVEEESPMGSAPGLDDSLEDRSDALKGAHVDPEASVLTAPITHEEREVELVGRHAR
jgi:EmrB/QacA subfamily drug resistance transporter